MADQKISQLTDAGAPLDTDQLVIARSGSSLSLLFSALKAAIPGGVTSLFGRTGAVTAQTGDYTAAQVGALPSTDDLSAIAAANATAANWSNNSHKITSLANGSGAQDAAAFGQIPTALPPNGSAGGDLVGSYPNPTVGNVAQLTTKGDLLVGAGSNVSARLPVGSNTFVLTADSAQTDGVKWAAASSGTTIGQPVLIFRYTVTGSDKASIDTGVDTPNAGNNDWTNCDLLEIILSARTDEATQGSGINLTFNNDTGSVYDYSWNRIAGTSAALVAQVADTKIKTQVPGTSVANTSVFGAVELKVPNPTGTVANKGLSGTWGFGDPGDSTNQIVSVIAGSYRPASPAALTRLAIAPTTGAQKLKVGSQLLIYKRLAS